MKVWVAVAISTSDAKYIAVGTTEKAAEASLKALLMSLPQLSVGDDIEDLIDEMFFIDGPIQVEVVQEYKP